MIYLDSAASSYPKPHSVSLAVYDWLKSNGANPGRSAHDMGRQADEKVFECRKTVGRFFGISPDRVVFTHNATHALNMAILGTVTPKSHVLISDIEHNSVYRPVYNSGASFSVVRSDDIIPDMKRKLKPNTDTVVMTLCSNLTGEMLPLKEIGGFAKENGLTFIADASQCAGHCSINLKNSGIDILCAPGHKGLFGIQGSGIMLLNGRMPAVTAFGGSGSMSASPEMPENAPERYEAGTLNTPAIIALQKGVEFIERVGADNIGEYERGLANILYDELASDSRFEILRKPESGILAFNVKGMTSEEAAEKLNGGGFCVRGGLHCAPLAHKKYGTLEKGAVRVSVSAFNRAEDVKKLSYFLKKFT